MSDQDPEKTAAEQALDHALEVFVYAPIGLLFEGASLLPQLVEKGKSQVTMARMIGQFAVTQGSGEANKIAGRLQDQAITVLAKLGGATPPEEPITPTALASRRRRPPPPVCTGSGTGTGTGRTDHVPRPVGSAGRRRHTGHPRLRRSVGLPRGQPPGRSFPCRARSRPRLRERQPRPEDDPVQGRPAPGRVAVDEACRPASAADLPRLVELVALAVEQQRGQKGGEVWARTAGRRVPFEPAIEASLADRNALVLVGELDGVALGYAVAHLEHLEDGGLLGVLTDLYVEPGGRELGLGEALMDGVVGWCRDAGCFGIDSLALPGDRGTKNFFETFGLVARAIVVHRSLR